MTKTLCAILMIVAAIIAGYLMIQKQQQNLMAATHLKSGSLLSSPVDTLAFELIDDHGKTFTNANLRGHWTLVFFGFTKCPSVCSATLHELKQVYDNLAVIDSHQLPRVLFISIDPHRDNSRGIHTYLSHYSPQFIGATGDQETLDNITNQLTNTFMKSAKPIEANYDIHHSGTILVINPKGQWIGKLTAAHNANTLTEDILKIQRVYHANHK